MGYELAKALEGTLWECTFDEQKELNHYDFIEYFLCANCTDSQMSSTRSSTVPTASICTSPGI